jgi:hypothetical protein
MQKWRMSAGLFLNHFVSLQAAFNKSRVDAPVEGCQRSPVLNCKRQEVVIGEVFRGRQNGKAAFVAE